MEPACLRLLCRTRRCVQQQKVCSRWYFWEGGFWARRKGGFSEENGLSRLGKGQGMLEADKGGICKRGEDVP